MAARAIIALIALLVLGGCGTTIPAISEAWDADIPPHPKLLNEYPISATAQIEFEIKKRIFCELRYAVQDAQRIPFQIGATDTPYLPNDWGALVSLSLTVDESTTLSPGVTINSLLPNATKIFHPGNSVTAAQSFSLGLGLNLSSKASNIDKFDSFYKIGRLAQKVSDLSICNPAHPENDPFVNAGFVPARSSPLITSQLGIRDWLIGALFSTRGIWSDSIKGSSISGKGQPDTMTKEFKFIIDTSGSVTPTWRLISVTANTAGQFLNLDRTRTHDLIITIGPPTAETAQTHFVQQTGNAVANSNRVIFGPP